MQTNGPGFSIIDLYAPRKKIYTREVSGRYASWRWACVWLTQLVYYGLPWLSWNGRPAVLFDLAARKFFVFGLVLWPQDFIYLAGVLILCAALLFLLSAVAGRVWCSFACPHTVYAEIFMWIERKIEGSRSARIRLDKQAISFDKIAKKSLKHLAWTAVALWTGITLVGYFTPMPVLLSGLARFTLTPWQAFWILFYAAFAYLNAGWLREQICKHMCAYARFQSVMFDKDTLLITYDAARGEPRGVRRNWRRGAANSLGDCIDCSLCLQVCPTGSDIRKGLPFECIDCASCIDACDSVMDKIGAPRGLIRYSTANAMQRGLSAQEIRRRIARPRVLIYLCMFLLGICVMAVSLTRRVPLKVDVMLDRAAIGRDVGGGMVENVYRLQIMNTDERPHAYRIRAGGIDSIAIVSPAQVEVDSATSRSVAVNVRAERRRTGSGAGRIRFELVALDDERVRIAEDAAFYVPPN
ncbi:cytochrome c oxidase accessory protein CcoG [Noviherbaspirillum sp.]|uniref:cytochrome c oxidase accessory protein CcoG n=1 Tax=Noviherbaspirillum sp. TaxID=1926288 RepID=UPI002B497F63|nr:cytochrome c oxidase accessory protein CcoG [Noviherbaspirillum sp.]HJV82324.1 cytochrome c oxidase accessory protein CcoG [Noviherbaspirillum sp.]